MPWRQPGRGADGTTAAVDRAIEDREEYVAGAGNEGRTARGKGAGVFFQIQFGLGSCPCIAKGKIAEDNMIKHDIIQ